MMNLQSRLKEILLIGICMAKLVAAYNQEPYQPSKVIPPSPTAASLEKYGDFQVGYYTGTPDINIPLLEIKTANHTVPIRMRYTSTGVKAAENAGWVGLGWSLSAGGAITRTVRGKDDFDNNGYYTAEALPALAAGLPRAEDKPYYDRIQLNQLDAEPDIFSYNFLEYSGRFVLSKRADGAKVFVDQRNNLRIEYLETTQKWLITTPDGYKYNFGTQERQTDYYYNSEYAEIADNEPLSSFQHDPKPDAITAWYLDAVTSPLGKTVNFIYAIKSNSLSLMSKSQHEDNLIHFDPDGCGWSPQFNAQYKFFTASRQIIQDVCLKEINFNLGSVEFFTSDRDDIEYTGTNKPQKLAEIVLKNLQGTAQKKFLFDYTYFTGSTAFDKRLSLVSIKEEGADGSFKLPYQFTYFFPNAMPPKYTKSIDHWGYYNGANNASLLPAALWFSPLSDVAPVYFDGANRRSTTQDQLLKPGVLSSITILPAAKPYSITS